MGKSGFGSWTAALLFALAIAAGCSSANEDDSGRGGAGSGDFGNAGGGAGTPSAGFGNGTGGNGGGATGPMLQDLSGPTTLTGTYIWIANSGEGTVSKIDTRSMEELGRYLTNPAGNGRPSRTSVGSTGAVVVANRGSAGGAPGAQAGIVKIEASEDLCQDSNGNGVIDTSTGAADVKAWMEDECMAWWTPLDFYSNRPVSWAPPAGPDLPETVWTAGTVQGGCPENNCAFSVLRLNGDTGVIEDRVEFSGLSGVGFIPFGVLTDFGPYGGAADAGGNFWGFVGTTMHLFRVDAVTLDTLTWPIPSGNGYGITVDPKGRVFLCGSQGLTRFDPATQTFQDNFGAVMLGFNGCMTDGEELIWVGAGGDTGAPGLHSFNADTMQYIETFPVGGVKGVSVDFDGKVWGVGGGNPGPDSDKAFRLDPTNGMVDTFIGLVGAYSYSDMTGHGLTTAGYIPVVVE